LSLRGVVTVARRSRSKLGVGFLALGSEQAPQSQERLATRIVMH
jgi:hypothetical protein